MARYRLHVPYGGFQDDLGQPTYSGLVTSWITALEDYDLRTKTSYLNNGHLVVQVPHALQTQNASLTLPDLMVLAPQGASTSLA